MHGIGDAVIFKFNTVSFYQACGIHGAVVEDDFASSSVGKDLEIGAFGFLE